jgi:hypothetical protein
MSKGPSKSAKGGYYVSKHVQCQIHDVVRGFCLQQEGDQSGGRKEAGGSSALGHSLCYC